MDIFKKKYIQLDVKAKDRNEALMLISKKAKELDLVDNVEALYEAFVEREKLSTTGFQDGIAIPHARIDGIKKAAVIVTRFANDVEWESLDKKPIVTAIAILIPKLQASDLHIDVLGKIASGLIHDDFRKLLKTEKNVDKIYQAFDKVINKKEEIVAAKPKDEKRKLVIGISACATGVVHTYMAKEALEGVADKTNYEVRIETQGQKGQEFNLTDEEIKRAEFVIIAADINVELDRFVAKRVLKCSTNDAINDPSGLILKASKQATKMTSGNNDNANIFAGTHKSGFMKHLLSGVSRMIPFIVFSGILWAIVNAVGLGIYGGSDGATLKDGSIVVWNDDLKLVANMVSVGFTVFIAFMGAYIADSIGGRAALAPGFIATFIAATPSFYWYWNGLIPSAITGDGMATMSGVSLTLFAAIGMGFAAGYLVKWMNSWKVHHILQAIMPIIVIPVAATSVLIFPFVFILSGPLSYLMNGFAYGIGYLGKIDGVNFLIGFILGAMIGFDMGGPVNKIAGTTATALIVIDPRLLGAVEAAIPIAPLACGFSTLVARNLFDDKEKGLGISALALGFMGISEGAIPFAVKRPKETLICNILGSAVAGGLAFIFFVGGHVGMWGGPIVALTLGVYADPGSIDTVIPNAFGGGGAAGMQYLSILWFFLAIAAGVLVHSTLYIILIKKSEGIKSEKTPSNNKYVIAFQEKFVKPFQERVITKSKKINENKIVSTKVGDKHHRLVNYYQTIANTNKIVILRR